jgi:hypothetical protein
LDWLDASGKLPTLASSLGAVFEDGWATAGLLAIVVGFLALLAYRYNRLLLAEKDARIRDNDEVGKLANNMREVLLLLGRKTEPIPPKGDP